MEHHVTVPYGNVGNSLKGQCKVTNDSINYIPKYFPGEMNAAMPAQKFHMDVHNNQKETNQILIN